MTVWQRRLLAIGSLAFLHDWLSSAVSLASALAQIDPGRLGAQQLQTVACALYAPTCLVQVVDPDIRPWTIWLLSGVSSLFWALILYGTWAGIGALRRRSHGQSGRAEAD